MASTNTGLSRLQEILDNIMKPIVWLKTNPSSLLRESPNPHGYQTFFNIINPYIIEYQTAVVEDQARLTQRTRAVEFAEDYISKLEAQDGGSNTQGIVEREQELLPVMRRNVVLAETRLLHSKDVLTEFQLIHRLLTSNLVRLETEVTPAESRAIDVGLGMIDSEWAKLQTELLPAAKAAKEQDAAEVPKKRKKNANKKKKKKNAGAAPLLLPDLSNEQRVFTGRVFSDDGILALDTEVVRGFSHDHKRDYWGWGVRRRAMTL